MKNEIKSIRAFIGSENFEISKKFYREMGFEEIITSEKMSYFKWDDFGFYLQDYYVKDWIENSMVFLEVNNLPEFFNNIEQLQLDKKFDKVRLSEIVKNDWGNEFFLHDPSGVLWHIGEFKF